MESKILGVSDAVSGRWSSTTSFMCRPADCGEDRSDQLGPADHKVRKIGVGLVVSQFGAVEAARRATRGRGHGEPLRLMVELGNDEDIVAAFIHRPAGKLLVAASDGRGFLVDEGATPAQTRAGRQVLNVKSPAEACACVAADGDAVAVVGENRRLLVFPLDEVPTLARGRGVILQRHRDGGLADATVFTLAEGLRWSISGRRRTASELEPWRGRRGQTGRVAPRGFPRSNRFSGP